MDNLVISGLNARTYDSTVSTDDTSDGPVTEVQVPENTVFKLFNNELDANIKQPDISAIHYLPTKKADKNKQESKDVIVWFNNRRASVMAKRTNLGD